MYRYLYIVNKIAIDIVIYISVLQYAITWLCLESVHYKKWSRLQELVIDSVFWRMPIK